MPACSTRWMADFATAFHVDELLRLFLRQLIERLGHRQLPPARLAGKESGQHVAQVHADLFDRRPRDDLERRHLTLARFDLDGLRVEPSGAQLLAQTLAGVRRLIAHERRVRGRLAERRRRDGRQEQIEQPLLGGLPGLVVHFLLALLAHHLDGDLDEIADHRLHVAADVADLGELRRLDLEEGRLRQPRQPPRDLGLADARRPDHQDVLRRDLLGHVGRAAAAGDTGCAARSRRRAWPSPGRRRTYRARRRSHAA